MRMEPFLFATKWAVELSLHHVMMRFNPRPYTAPTAPAAAVPIRAVVLRVDAETEFNFHGRSHFVFSCMCWSGKWCTQEKGAGLEMTATC